MRVVKRESRFTKKSHSNSVLQRKRRLKLAMRQPPTSLEKNPIKSRKKVVTSRCHRNSRTFQSTHQQIMKKMPTPIKMEIALSRHKEQLNTRKRRTSTSRQSKRKKRKRRPRPRKLKKTSRTQPNLNRTSPQMPYQSCQQEMQRKIWKSNN